MQIISDIPTFIEEDIFLTGDQILNGLLPILLGASLTHLQGSSHKLALLAG